MAIIGGALPFVGSAVSGMGGLWPKSEQNEINRILNAWLRLQQDQLEEIGQTLGEVLVRLDFDDPIVTERLASPEYLSLLKKAYRD